MRDETTREEDGRFVRRSLEAAIRIGVIGLLLMWCYQITHPFWDLILWGMIIAVAVYPLYRRLEDTLGGRSKLAAVLFTVGALSLLLAPTLMLGTSTVEHSLDLARGLQNGKMPIPPPPEKVKSWPVIGESVFSSWHLASSNLAAAVRKLAPQLQSVASWFLALAASGGTAIVKLMLSLVVAGLFLAKTDAAEAFAIRLATRAAGERADAFVDMAKATVRSVAQGVLGIAVVQAVAAGVGLLVIDVPGAGLLALGVLLLAVMQLPPILILGPVAAWVFSTHATIPAVLFLLWSLLVSVSDGFLKPLLLGRGVDVPMAVILLGAIGGMMTKGIIGLFLGAVILALVYKLFLEWLDAAPPSPETSSAPSGDEMAREPSA